MPDGVQNRQCVRIPYAEHVLINKQLRVRGIDLSEGGLYVHTGRSFPNGQEVEVSLPVMHELHTIKARVQFHREGVGMGLMFLDISPENLSAIREHINRHLEKHVGVADTLDKKTVIIVGSNELSVKMYRSALVLAGFSVIETKTKEQTIEAMDEPLAFHAILFVGNVEMDSVFQEFNAIAQKASNRVIPLVVVSPSARIDTPARIVEAGAYGFLASTSASPKKVTGVIVNL